MSANFFFKTEHILPTDLAFDINVGIVIIWELVRFLKAGYLSIIIAINCCNNTHL